MPGVVFIFFFILNKLLSIVKAFSEGHSLYFMNVEFCVNLIFITGCRLALNVLSSEHFLTELHSLQCIRAQRSCIGSTMHITRVRIFTSLVAFEENVM